MKEQHQEPTQEIHESTSTKEVEELEEPERLEVPEESKEPEEETVQLKLSLYQQVCVMSFLDRRLWNSCNQ